VVDLAEIEASHNDATQGNRAFNVELGIILPLYSIIMLHHEPSIRERILLILFSAPRQEGFWDSIAAATLANSVIENGDAGGELGVMDLPRRSKGAKLTYSERLKKIQQAPAYPFAMTDINQIR
jgi:hypothetical protein